MDISLNWLNRYVKIDDITPTELAAKITSVGLEVEGMHELAFGTNLVVGYVHECEMHPDSDHLHVCQVEIKPGEISQIVCGAPNVDKGQKVIVALPGCELHGGTIKNSKIRGVESNGMICSLSELGIDARFQTEEQKAGIEILPADAPIGDIMSPKMPFIRQLRTWNKPKRQKIHSFSIFSHISLLTLSYNPFTI